MSSTIVHVTIDTHYDPSLRATSVRVVRKTTIRSAEYLDTAGNWVEVEEGVMLPPSILGAVIQSAP